jgi:3-methyladenine DNA glycosylase AlkD
MAAKRSETVATKPGAARAGSKSSSAKKAAKVVKTAKATTRAKAPKPAKPTNAAKSAKPGMGAKTAKSAKPATTTKTTRTTQSAEAIAANARSSPSKSTKPRERLALETVLAALEAAGTPQNRKIYARHGAEEPMFGVSFAELSKLVKRIGVDHELSAALWETGNSDAQTLAVKVADPRAFTPRDLERWLASVRYKLLVDGVAQLAAEGDHARTLVESWLGKAAERELVAGWGLVGYLAARDASLDDAWFAKRLSDIEAKIARAPNLAREAMNRALITIGGRSTALRKAAIATAERIGPVEVDHGETSCETPEAGSYIEKCWAHAEAKGFESPAAQERARLPVRVRC